MSIAQDQFEMALLRLKQARRTMRDFASGTADLVGKVTLDAAYEALIDDLLGFAKNQFNITPEGCFVKPSRKKKAVKV